VYIVKMKLSLKNPIDDFKPKIDEFFKNIPKEVPEIPFGEIPKKGKYELPSGGYGEAYLSDDKTRAIKIINMNRHFSDKMINSLRNEIVNYHRISTLCPKYFCKFIGYSYNADEFVVAIVMENCGIDLLEFFNYEIDEKYRLKYTAAENNRTMVEEIDIEKMSKLKFIFYKILEAIDCLHYNGYVHLDIKPENIVVLSKSGTYEIKFIDAGSLTRITPGTKTYVFGTEKYMAPELLQVRSDPLLDNNVGLTKLDIYSFGKMCKEMLTKKEILCMFSGDKIIKETLERDPKNRPDALKIMFFMNPSLYIKSLNHASAQTTSESVKENSHPNKTNRKRRKVSKSRSKRSKSKSK
jgi:serine/threonine protein kinase